MKTHKFNKIHLQTSLIYKRLQYFHLSLFIFAKYTMSGKKRIDKK